MDPCDRIRRICPDFETLYNRLSLKRRMAWEYYPAARSGSGRKYNLIVDYARQLFGGRLQRVDLSEPPPPPEVVRTAIMDTFPALWTCVNAKYYCERGQEHNYVMLLSGAGGVGKTTYALYLAALLGGQVLTSEDDIVRGVMEMIERGQWLPLLIFDDINAIMSKYWVWIREERSWVDFFKMLDYAKDLTATLMVTARSAEGPPRKFRELANYTGFVRILPLGSYLVYFVEWYAGTAMNPPPVAIDVWWPGLKLPPKLWQYIKTVRRLRSKLLLLEVQKKRAADELEQARIEEEMEKIREELKKVQKASLVEVLEEE